MTAKHTKSADVQKRKRLKRTEEDEDKKEKKSFGQLYREHDRRVLQYQVRVLNDHIKPSGRNTCEAPHYDLKELEDFELHFAGEQQQKKSKVCWDPQKWSALNALFELPVNSSWDHIWESILFELCCDGSIMPLWFTQKRMRQRICRVFRTWEKPLLLKNYHSFYFMSNTPISPLTRETRVCVICFSTWKMSSPQWSFRRKAPDFMRLGSMVQKHYGDCCPDIQVKDMDFYLKSRLAVSSWAYKDKLAFKRDYQSERFIRSHFLALMLGNIVEAIYSFTFSPEDVFNIRAQTKEESSVKAIHSPTLQNLMNTRYTDLYPYSVNSSIARIRPLDPQYKTQKERSIEIPVIFSQPYSGCKRRESHIQGLNHVTKHIIGHCNKTGDNSFYLKDLTDPDRRYRRKHDIIEAVSRTDILHFKCRYLVRTNGFNYGTVHPLYEAGLGNFLQQQVEDKNSELHLNFPDYAFKLEKYSDESYKGFNIFLQHKLSDIVYLCSFYNHAHRSVVFPATNILPVKHSTETPLQYDIKDNWNILDPDGISTFQVPPHFFSNERDFKKFNKEVTFWEGNFRKEFVY